MKTTKKILLDIVGLIAVVAFSFFSVGHYLYYVNNTSQRAWTEYHISEPDLWSYWGSWDSYVTLAICSVAVLYYTGKYGPACIKRLKSIRVKAVIVSAIAIVLTASLVQSVMAPPLLVSSGTIFGNANSSGGQLSVKLFFDNAMTSNEREKAYQMTFDSWYKFDGSWPWITLNDTANYYWIHALLVMWYTNVPIGDFIMPEELRFTPQALELAIESTGNYIQKYLPEYGVFESIWNSTTEEQFAIFFTTAPIDMQGLGVARWNAAMIRWPTSTFVLVHEFSHLLGLSHCTHWDDDYIGCIMNPNIVYFDPNSPWCPDCKHKIEVWLSNP